MQKKHDQVQAAPSTMKFFGLKNIAGKAARQLNGLAVIILLFALTLALTCCRRQNTSAVMFNALESDRTGLHFTNKLTSTDSFNLFKYMYFYNGAGVGAGDFNNDGKIDVFFSSNQGTNTLYLNSGGLKFRDVSSEAKIPTDNAWNTGVSVADVNQDGLLDIYVCRVGNYRSLHSQNQLLICQGINGNGVPYYEDKAKEYGLDFSGFSTQSAFFDYDLDGDLDMFLLNHSVHENGTFRPRSDFLGTYNELSGGRMFRNDGGHFTDVTRQSGINSSAINYGLGIVVSDINLDGYPDVYIGNDFHENDYLYINQKNGTFKEELNEHMMHTSQFSMGVDAADINNDAYPDIISVDMLPDDPYVLKRSLGEDEYDVFNRKIGYGYNYQYTRNNLQFNRCNGMFSEVGMYCGIAATDWSWAPLWLDFDNDGLKDLFISNGIPKRMNDIDYINFISDNEIQQKIIDNRMNETNAALIDKFPQIKLPNKFYQNTGQLMFHDLKDEVSNNKETYSNGAVYADFDNDGDLDIMVNNIDEPVLLYENKNVDRDTTGQFLELVLKGSSLNPFAVGSKVVVFAGHEKRVYEKYPVHGFQSSMEMPLHIGLKNTKVDSIILIWPDNSCQQVLVDTLNRSLVLKYQDGLRKFDYNILTPVNAENGLAFTDITRQAGINYVHTENSFPEFNREPLLPHLLSTESPALAIGDINNDGLEDVFFGSSRNYKSRIYLQSKNGSFSLMPQPALEADSVYEDVSAQFVDVNNDGNIDLVVASGGNEFYGKENYLLPRLYINDGKGAFTKKQDAFEGLYITASVIAANDFNGDGFADLFIGARTTPWDYGIIPTSFLLLNNKKGKFTNVTNTYAPGLANAGLVTNACWADLDRDGRNDLLLSLEWGSPTAFMNVKGKLEKKELSDKKGWWNFVTPVDIDNDGDLDLVAGNLGLNSRLKASEKEPVRLYYNDFDDNGKKEQVLTYYLKGKEIPFANKAELEKQMPVLKKRFLYAKNLAEASLSDIFTSAKLSSANVLTANYFSNAVFINDGKMNFTAHELPWNAQFSSYRDVIVTDINGDALPDLLLAGNYYDNNIEMGRYDADFGTALINKGNGKFEYINIPGLVIKGQARHLGKINISGSEAIVVARNNDSAMVLRFQKAFKKKD